MRLVKKDESQVWPSESPELLDALIQGSPVATFVIDHAHRITHWNKACELVTGVAARDL